MTNSGAGELLAAVNRVIDKLHGSLGLIDSDFFCECGHSTCRKRIKLTRTQYASLRDDDRPILVADHHRRPGVAKPQERHVARPARHLSGDLGGR